MAQTQSLKNINNLHIVLNYGTVGMLDCVNV